MHDLENDNIFDEDDALDFIIYEELEKQNNEPKNGKGGCLGTILLLLVPAASMIFINWK